MTVQRKPVMMWWAKTLPEFERGVGHFYVKYGERPVFLFVSQKHKNQKDGGWDLPDSMQIVTDKALAENYYVFAVNAEDWDATGERSFNETVPSVSERGGKKS